MKRKFIDFDQPEKVAAFSSKNGVDVSTVPYAGSKVFIFECSTCGKDFKRTTSTVTHNNTWCPCCNSPHMCKTPECEVCFKKSFAFYHPEKALCWSDRNNSRPENMPRASREKIWFDCDKCPHTFENSLGMIDLGKWCPFCHNHKMCPDSRECADCYPKTFEFKHPKEAACWSPLNDKPAHQVFAGTNSNAWFDCDNCPHSFSMRVRGINAGHWCKYCANMIMCEDTDCTDCFVKSLQAAIPEGEIIWSTRNTEEPSRVFSHSRKKAHFQCVTCEHEFESRIESVTSGARCPICRPNRNMKAIVLELRKYKGVTFQSEETLRYKNKILFCDMTVTTKWGIFRIESDGPQHFDAKAMMIISRTKDASVGEIRFKGQRERDLLKEEYINKNDLLLFRVSYRQLKNMGNLVKDMMTLVENGMKGVGYTDPLYDYWVHTE